MYREHDPRVVKSREDAACPWTGQMEIAFDLRRGRNGNDRTNGGTFQQGTAYLQDAMRSASVRLCITEFLSFHFLEYTLHVHGARAGGPEEMRWQGIEAGIITGRFVSSVADRRNSSGQIRST